MSRLHVDYRLYFVLDAEHVGERDPVAIARSAALGGVTAIQWRDKGCRYSEGWARGLARVLRELEVPLIVNDDPELARRIGATGVHVGQRDASPREARRILGSEAIVGLSVTALPELSTVDSTVDYVGYGPVFFTATKADAAPPTGLLDLQEAVRSLPVPVVAIGGVTAANAARCIAHGAAGVAVVSAILGHPDAAIAARALRASVDGVAVEAP